MKWDHIIKNGILVDAHSCQLGNIYIKDGKIQAVSSGDLPGEAPEITDATGCYVLPGLIDTHVHSRDGENGATYKEDFFHSSMAAACGGLTTIFEMPNSNPAIYNVEMLHKQINNLTPKAHVDFAIWGLCLGNINIKELLSLSEAGVIAFKFFWGYAIDSSSYQLIYNYAPEMENVVPPLMDGEIYDMFQVIAKTGKQVAIHAENFYLIKALTAEVEAENGEKSYANFLRCRPAEAELTTIRSAIALCRLTGARLHVLHLGAGDGVQLIADAQAEGLPVTAETCPHYLELCDEDYANVGPMIKVYPLVKTRYDQELLWQGLRDGIINLVCSDHAPHTPEEKNNSLWESPAGMAAVETLAPIMINAVSAGKISINQLAAVLSENPAKMYGIYPQKGSLHPGTDADITIIDLKQSYTIRNADLHSKSKVSAFDGFHVQGRAVQTILRGKTIAKNGEIIGQPGGRFIRG